ncbi:MAG: tetratricopeptide repeat protein [Acidobacteriota bacterium]|nr:tetratricopeptide repeat protein [Acidobacteriota bacterium]
MPSLKINCRLAGIALLLIQPVRAVSADSVAVLPLFNQTKAPNLDWIGESVSETIRESLASEGLLALSREDRMEVFRRLSIRPNAVLTRASVLKVGEALDAARIIFGQYEIPVEEGVNANAKGTIKLSARVVDLKRLKAGPEFEASGPLEDLSALETHLAWQFVRHLAPQSAPSEEEFRRVRPPVRVDAIENYTRGLLANSLEQKQKLFAQAAHLDERFSEPCFQLGRIFWEKKDYHSAAQWLAKVNSGDSHYLDAMFLLGLTRYYQGDFAGAASQFQLVAGQAPLNEVYNDLGAAQSRRNLPEAVESFKKALEGDEADPDYWFNEGYALWKARSFDAAAEKFRSVLDRTPNDGEATVLLGRCLKDDGPRAAELREGKERLKENFELTAFRQLQAEIGAKRSK